MKIGLLVYGGLMSAEIQNSELIYWFQSGIHT